MGLVPVLIGYLLLKDRGPFVHAHTTAAINFHLSLLIYWALALVTSVIFIGLVLIVALPVYATVLAIVAAVAASNGRLYTYPLSITFLR